MNIPTTSELDARILKDALAALEKSGQAEGEAGPVDMSRDAGNTSRERLWRSLMRSTWTKLAMAAAAIAIVATVSLTFLNKSVPAAYALDQTVAANRELRYVHVKITPAPSNHIREQLSEAWVQMDPQGQLQYLKMDFSRTDDGPKVVLWKSDNTAEVWFKKKKGVVVVRDPNIVARIPTMMAMFDPKLVIENVYKAHAAGEITLETKLPTAEGEPITLTTINVPGRGHQNIYTVDPATKLVTHVEMNQFDGKTYQTLFSWDYLDYNAEPAPGSFELGAPPDVARVDETTQVIGLYRGTLSDSEITSKVARQFFEALIAQDYAKACQLLSDVPLPELQKHMDLPATKYLRVVSMGEPEVQPIAGVGGMQVDCQVEIEQNGVKSVKHFKVAVRPVYSQPQNWTIHGL